MNLGSHRFTNSALYVDFLNTFNSRITSTVNTPSVNAKLIRLSPLFDSARTYAENHPVSIIFERGSSREAAVRTLIYPVLVALVQ